MNDEHADAIAAATRVMKIKLRRDGTTQDVLADVFGGYSNGPKVVCLCRLPPSTGGYQDVCLLRLPNNPTRLTLCTEELDLPLEDWPRFLALPVKTIFRLGGHNWCKLEASDLRRLIGRKRFTYPRFTCTLAARASREKVPRETATGHEGVTAHIAMPSFALELLLRQQCPFCHTPFMAADVVAAGVRRRPEDGRCYFSYECDCAKCHQPTRTVMTSRPCTMAQLREVLAAMFD